ncbi:MAG: lysophospholipid acyltransferase family protein [Candidatus Paceibacterota bacterium]
MENIPQKGNFILVSNHLSHADSFMSGYIITPRKFTFLSQIDQYAGFKKILRDLVYLWGGVIPVNRKSNESKKQAIETAIKMLKNGFCLVVYPEGGRAYDGVMREFKFGVGKLHLDSGVPVLPVALRGTRELMPPHGGLKFKKTAEIVIGEPLNFAKEREMARSLDKNSGEYRNLCRNIAKKIEGKVRELSNYKYEIKSY